MTSPPVLGRGTDRATRRGLLTRRQIAPARPFPGKLKRIVWFIHVALTQPEGRFYAS